MKRRSFLTTTTLASAGLSTFLISGFSDIEKKEESKLAQNSIDIFELEEETITSLNEKLASGKYTSEKLVKLYLKRIEDIDKNGSKLNSIIELNPDALSMAKAMDVEMKARKLGGPLHGIPV